MDEDYLAEYGSCPNCGSGVHVSELGSEFGITCCKYCYEEVRNHMMDHFAHMRIEPPEQPTSFSDDLPF